MFNIGGERTAQILHPRLTQKLLRVWTGSSLLCLFETSFGQSHMSYRQYYMASRAILGVDIGVYIGIILFYIASPTRVHM